MTRVILHSDMNNFYASCECLHRPELSGRPVIVGGDPEMRHGIVLAKNGIAKAAGVKTAETLRSARDKCPAAVVLPPNFKLYMDYSRRAKAIYAEYTDQVESFGLDEAWLDVTGSGIRGNGEHIANEIRARVRSELGITASVGVSYNKIFAKLGSDMKKPDATTVISESNYKNKVWPLAVGELLYVGPSSQQRLYQCGITSIGQLANASESLLDQWLGKWGHVLRDFANGLDHAPVARADQGGEAKSIGNSTTTPHDLVSDEDAYTVFLVLCESVARRLREEGFRCTTVQISIRDDKMVSIERQIKLKRPTNLSLELAQVAMALFRSNWSFPHPIRSLGVRGTQLVRHDEPVQLSIFINEEQRLKQENLEKAIDAIRSRFGHSSIGRAIMLKDHALGGLNPKEDNVIFPVSYF